MSDKYAFISALSFISKFALVEKPCQCKVQTKTFIIWKGSHEVNPSILMVLMRSIYCYTDCFHRNSHKLCNFSGNSQHIQNKQFCFKCHIINCFTALSPYCHNQGLIFPSMALVLSYKKLISKMVHRFQSSTSIFFQSTGSNPQYGPHAQLVRS